MLRDYIVSMALLALVLGIYTAIVINNKRSTQEARLESPRAAASVNPTSPTAPNGVSAAASTP